MPQNTQVVASSWILAEGCTLGVHGLNVPPTAPIHTPFPLQSRGNDVNAGGSSHLRKHLSLLPPRSAVSLLVSSVGSLVANAWRMFATLNDHWRDMAHDICSSHHNILFRWYCFCQKCTFGHFSSENVSMAVSYMHHCGGITLAYIMWTFWFEAAILSKSQGSYLI